jgi:hypothetical protein
MGSFPLKESGIAMITISTRTKEITTTMAEQKNMQELITLMADKALV